MMWPLGVFLPEACYLAVVVVVVVYRSKDDCGLKSNKLYGISPHKNV